MVASRAVGCLPSLPRAAVFYLVIGVRVCHRVGHGDHRDEGLDRPPCFCVTLAVSPRVKYAQRHSSIFLVSLLTTYCR